jgi:putative endonuclease
MFHVDMLRSAKTGRRYVGSCAGLNNRIDEHDSGESKATRHGVPWTVVYNEQLETRADATRRERYFKTGKGRDELDKLRV